MSKPFIKRRLIENEDQDSADFMRELRQVDPEKVRAFLDEQLSYDPEAKVWKLVEFTDYTGTTADRANARYLIKNYPVIVPNTGAQFNKVTVGIPEASLDKMDSEMAASLFEQIKKLTGSGLLDEDEYRTVETIKREEAWKHQYRQEFVNKLKQKFQQVDEEYIDEERLRGLFEDARDLSGAEWSEGTGAGQSVDTSGITEKITPEMLSEWLFPDQGGVEAEIESIMEGRKFSCIMAPASPDIIDAVQQFSRMFITDDKLYNDPEEPSDFGREDEVHVTVKFGLHEKDPGPDLLKIIEQTEPFEIEVGPVSLFENEKFDVVKFDIEGEGLFRLNARISAELECTDTYPEYHPHMTVAYVTKGTCRELVGKRLLQTDETTSARFLVKSVIFSSLTKEKTRLFLGKPNLEMEPVLEAVVEPAGEADQQAAVTNKGPETVAKPSLSHYTTNKAPGTHEGMPWTREQAEVWLQSVRPALEAVGYSAQIVGSVDKHGESEKDLDILLTPVGDKHNVTGAVYVLAEHSKWWGRADEDLFNAVLPDGRIVEFWFDGLQSLIDEINWETQEDKPEGTAYTDEATQLPKGSLYVGKLGTPEVQESFDPEEEADAAKEVSSDGKGYKDFTDADVDTSGQFPRIYTDRKELIYDPTPWQKQGLQQTATGYGAKLNTGYRIAFNGKLYRLYSTTYGNAGSTWFMAGGRKIFVS